MGIFLHGTNGQAHGQAVFPNWVDKHTTTTTTKPIGRFSFFFFKGRETNMTTRTTTEILRECFTFFLFLFANQIIITQSQPAQLLHNASFFYSFSLLALLRFKCLYFYTTRLLLSQL
ncbi:hypothetical protein QBC41DRAFT_65504 [Cercophora samala]|uniref:Uncharacterized protein n=1 Tax=Cercophora samala TaxID=330535 RepID=A0AA40DER5_9PEZI|nr:hypothetical protein QBC41DRAFT_65504 [Cercophora samala]